MTLHAAPRTCTRSDASLISRGLRVVLVLTLLVAGTTLTITTAGAQQQGSVGVSPATAEFTDPPLLPGGTSQVVLKLQQRYAQPIDVHVAALPLSGDAGDAHTWLRLDREGHMVLSPGIHEFIVKIQVPETAANGLYKAGVAFEITPEETAQGDNSSATAKSSVTATLTIDVNNENEVKRLEVRGQPTIHPTEEGAPLRVSVPVANTGNVDITPKYTFELKDPMQRNVVKTFTASGMLIRPGQEQNQTVVIQKPGLERGQYWMSVTTLLDGNPVGVSDPASFDVLAPGELARHAELRSIRIDGDVTRVTVGQLVKLTAVVVNTGQGPLVAEFEGEVLRDGVLVEGLGSKAVEIPVGETGALTMLYRIDEPGKYEFQGRAFYGSKVTEEKSLIVTAAEESAFVPSVGFGGAIAGLCGVVLVATMVARRRPADAKTR